MSTSSAPAPMPTSSTAALAAPAARHYLPDGRSFVVNIDGHSQAFSEKKAFIVSIGEHSLRHEKCWNVATLRMLATGIISVKEGKKNKTKEQLLDSFAEMLKEARELGALRYQALISAMQDSGYNAQKLEKMLAALSGQELVDSIAASLKGQGLADASIVKTYLPDIYKAIRAYGDADAEDVIKMLKASFFKTQQAVNELDKAAVIQYCNNVRPIRLEPLQGFLDGLDITSASWKELSVFLILATGRRMAEIHGEATSFSYIDEHHVMFEGQLKTKGRGVTAPYSLYVFADARRVIEAWERLCSLKPPMSPEAVNKKLSKPLSSEKPVSIAALYATSGIEQYKDMRDVYAARMLLQKPETMTANAFISRCMGHGADDIATANTYQKLRIV